MVWTCGQLSTSSASCYLDDADADSDSPTTTTTTRTSVALLELAVWGR